MANIILYKHEDLEIYLELIADDSTICFKELGGIHIDKEYRGIHNNEFNKMAKELEELITNLNDSSISERAKVSLYIDYISYWDDHYDTHILTDGEINEYTDENGNIDEDNPYIFKLNGFYIYDKI